MTPQFVRQAIDRGPLAPGDLEELGLTPADVARLGAVIEAFYKTSVHNLDGLLGRFLDRLEKSGLEER